MAKFKALSNGTMSDPYRFVAKDEVVELNVLEAAFYIKSKWLRPLEEVLAIKPQPIMPHMRIVGGGDDSGQQTKMPPYSVPGTPKSEQPAVGNANYDANIAAIQGREALEDGIKLPAEANLADVKQGEEAATGTGNQDPLA